jgi:hypothetical protein
MENEYACFLGSPIRSYNPYSIYPCFIGLLLISKYPMCSIVEQVLP